MDGCLGAASLGTARGAGDRRTDPIEATVRILVVFSLAFAVGLERQLHRKPAGFATFIFVATGSCLLSITAVDLVPDAPLILLSGTITGIGFLGAGALIRYNDRVFGFTTAAMIWAMAAFGIALGAGEYVFGLAFYAMLWVVILSDRFLEEHGFGSHARLVRLTLADDLDLPGVESLLRAQAHIDRFAWDKEGHTIRVTAHVRIRSREIPRLVRELREHAGVRAVEVE